MNKYYYKIICYCVFSGILFFTSCQDGSNTIAQKTASTNKVTETNSIPVAENGITVVLPKGWEKKEMDFQQRYCEDMMAGVEGVNNSSFCSCFLQKIQYYYKPIYAREAFTDQKKWNEECFELAKNN